MRTLLFLLSPLLVLPSFGAPIPELPEPAKLALHEDWTSGKIAPTKWYPLRKKWGKNNHGVVPENVSVVDDTLDGKPIKALRCRAHGDLYEGPVTGQWGKKKRVGGVLVTKQHFASGRFEVVMKIGTKERPTPPGMVPAIWTYGYRGVKVDEALADDFTATQPIYNPFLQEWGKGNCFYWSEIDFPEFGKAGDYAKPMYNTFLNKKHHSLTFDAGGAADGRYHTYTTDWRTQLLPIDGITDGITDAQVAEADGFYWIQDKAVPLKSYFGNPLKKLGKDRYAICAGLKATHWIDGRPIGENTKFVPSMGAQLNLGVWLPEWAGAAPWQTADIYFASVKIWQYGDPGDVLGIAIKDITNNFNKAGQPVR